jgi:hypothetical protein
LKTGLIGALVAGVVVLAGGGFYAYKKFLAPEPLPPSRPVVAPRPAAPVDKPSAPLAVNLGNAPVITAAGSVNASSQPAAPGQLPASPGGAPAAPVRAQINSAVAAQQAPLNEVLAADRSAPVGVSAAASALPPAHPAAGAAVPARPAGPDPAVQAWVAGVHIGGVRIGDSPRIFIDGVTYRAGDMVKPELGIRFDSADADREVLIFKDRTGAIVEKKY